MSTQLIQAKNGIITPEMLQVAQKENIDVEWLRGNIAEGKIIIPKNVNRNFSVNGIGNGLSTKINANIGTSEKHCDLNEELEKWRLPLNMEHMQLWIYQREETYIVFYKKSLIDLL